MSSVNFFVARHSLSRLAKTERAPLKLISDCRFTDESVHLAHPDTIMQNLAADSVFVDVETDPNTEVGRAALVDRNPIVVMQARL